jgi:nicotinamide-nucleotide amidase
MEDRMARSDWDFVPVEIIAVGRELLSGRTLDTNSHWLARRITALGGSLRRIVVVDDRIEEIVTELRKALRRPKALVITTGGLGPTFDDLTLQAVARVTGRELLLDPGALSFVRQRYCFFHEQGAVESSRITPKRRKMALLPRDAVFLPNAVGAAPGVKLEVKGRLLYALPGVPAEMRSIFEVTMVEDFKQLFGRRIILEETIPTPFNDESKLGVLVDQVMKEVRGVYLKSKATAFGRGIRLDLVITASGDKEKAARERICEAEARLRRLWSPSGR